MQQSTGVTVVELDKYKTAEIGDNGVTIEDSQHGSVTLTRRDLQVCAMVLSMRVNREWVPDDL